MRSHVWCVCMLVLFALRMRCWHCCRKKVCVYAVERETVFSIESYWRVIWDCTLGDTAIRCDTLQHTATYCYTLPHTATHCNTLQHTATQTCDVELYSGRHCDTLQNTLQHTATHCNIVNTLQHTATHCNALQHNLLGLYSGRHPKCAAGWCAHTRTGAPMYVCTHTWCRYTPSTTTCVCISMYVDWLMVCLMYVCMTCIHKYRFMYVCVHTYRFMYVYAYIHTDSCMSSSHAYIHAYIHTYMRTYKDICIHTYIQTNLLHTYTHTHVKTRKNTHANTHIQAHTLTHTQDTRTHTPWTHTHTFSAPPLPRTHPLTHPHIPNDRRRAAGSAGKSRAFQTYGRRSRHTYNTYTYHLLFHLQSFCWRWSVRAAASASWCSRFFSDGLNMTVFTENATSSKSTRLRTLDLSVSCGTNSNWDVDLIWIFTKKFEFQIWVSVFGGFRGVSLSDEFVMHNGFIYMYEYEYILRQGLYLDGAAAAVHLLMLLTPVLRLKKLHSKCN